jgi:hypothetical protein
MSAALQVWSLHALANVLTGLSTATLVVEAVKQLYTAAATTTTSRDGSTVRSCSSAHALAAHGQLDQGRGAYACTAICSHGHKQCVVCHLLTRDQPPRSSSSAHTAGRSRLD